MITGRVLAPAVLAVGLGWAHVAPAQTRVVMAHGAQSAGMAPLCYAQAYFADRLFRILPGSLWIVATLGLAYAAAVIWVLIRLGRRRPRSDF